MNSRLFIFTLSLTDTIPQKSTWFPAWVCIMRRMICLKRPSFSSSVPSKFSRKRSSGLLWLLLATEEWICSTKLWKSMRKSTNKTLKTSTVWEVSSKLERSWEWSTSSLQRSLWFWTERKKLVVSTSTIKIHKHMRCSSSSNSSSLTFSKHLICQIWEESSTAAFLWIRELQLPKLSRKKTTVVGVTLPLCSTELVIRE